MAPVLAVGRAGYFYPRSPCGERRSGNQQPAGTTNFYPRSPCGERQHINSWSDHIERNISIHALLAESDRQTPLIRFSRGTFLSTLSLRRATDILGNLLNGRFNFYPRSPCGERPMQSYQHAQPHSDFYPRSPCGERHEQKCGDGKADINFYPRSPCGERPCTTTIITCTALFLSTLSLRRATSKKSDHLQPTNNFYPRSPCGERPLCRAIGFSV